MPKNESKDKDEKIFGILSQDDMEAFFHGIVEQIQENFMPGQSLWRIDAEKNSIENVRLVLKNEKQIQKEIEIGNEQIEKQIKAFRQERLLHIGDGFFTEATFKSTIFVLDESNLINAFNQEVKLYKDVSRAGG